ncbi:murein L,D-transpeptidase catalytic domain-containing protein [Flavobacterium sedimenticola]|uniref:Murein L,D-transpeptidase catalytic domain family protein n=1 Tax=Flavobacterium sedimenticola TaxID=3043286 RepID=A0ABT6XQI7_9FLAO|nr:murein L,D-transpeptidase catalytic domain family protein [Flavobacterium sedimenticola]MDI9257345.1 murein L,D-transpeptidase catalytic domain family protein [Flavobacterium sedimenticola]
MKKKLVFLLLFIGALCSYKTIDTHYKRHHKPKADVSKTHTMAQEALAFCKKNGYNSDFCILIDMSIHSGLNRFFVYDFTKNTISHKMLVGHGCCDYPWSQDWSKSNPTFSNVDGSHCSALGKYKIGKRAWSDWGIHVKYVLHGLEPTNSNAESRYIVFHSWEKVADTETYPIGTPEGWGCPTISNANMKKIDPILKASAQPVLMWIYK